MTRPRRAPLSGSTTIAAWRWPSVSGPVSFTAGLAGVTVSGAVISVFDRAAAAGELAQADAADRALGVVEHRQQADAAVEEEAAGGGGVGVAGDRDHVAGHDLAAGQLRVAAGEDLELELGEQQAEVVAVDVEGLADAGEDGVEVLVADADPGARQRVAGRRLRRLAVRVGVAGEAVEGPADRDQEDRVEGHRGEREPPAGGVDEAAADHPGERRRAAGRVQRAGHRHHADRQSDADAAGDRPVSQRLPDREAGQGGERVAADDRPRLRHRAGGDGEEEDRRGAHRRDDPGQRLAVAVDQRRDEAREADADDRAETGEGPVASGRAGQDGSEAAQGPRSLFAPPRPPAQGPALMGRKVLYIWTFRPINIEGQAVSAANSAGPFSTATGSIQAISQWWPSRSWKLRWYMKP